jgi:hypothetical protein
MTPRLDAEVQDWLVGQACDQLANGAVGLYEVVWWLEISRFRLTPALIHRLARGLAREFVGCGLADLLLISWPSYRVLAGPLPLSILDHDDAWLGGCEFVALVSGADGAGNGQGGRAAQRDETQAAS